MGKGGGAGESFCLVPSPLVEVKKNPTVVGGLVAGGGDPKGTNTLAIDLPSP